MTAFIHFMLIKSKKKRGIVWYVRNSILELDKKKNNAAKYLFKTVFIIIAQKGMETFIKK